MFTREDLSWFWWFMEYWNGRDGEWPIGLHAGLCVIAVSTIALCWKPIVHWLLSTNYAKRMKRIDFLARGKKVPKFVSDEAYGDTHRLLTIKKSGLDFKTVSYTHLTLPTIYSV